MDYTNINYLNSGGSVASSIIQSNSVKCPHCKIAMIPHFIFGRKREDNYLTVFCQCTNPECKDTFLVDYTYGSSGVFVFSALKPNTSMDKKDFSEIIREISSSFCEIYNQAYAAQQMNLSQICGVGYRKAFEFLVKDYILSFIDEDKKDGIKQKNLSKCIQEDISSPNIKAVAARATWIGNDETHYVRKWQDKDIKDLIGMIDLTIHWVESEIKTKRLLEEMPIS